MKFKNPLLILLFLVIISVAGCQNDTKDEKKEKSESVATKIDNGEERVVKEIKVHEAPENSPSPSQAVIHQFEVIFDNGESQFPNKESIVTETILGDQAILTIHSPEEKNRYAIFLYTANEEWSIEGVLRLGTGSDAAFTDKKGLDLPMKKFNANSITVKENEKNKEVWAFVDEQSVITIARFERFSFDENPNTKTIILQNGNEAYISKDY